MPLTYYVRSWRAICLWWLSSRSLRPSLTSKISQFIFWLYWSCLTAMQCTADHNTPSSMLGSSILNSEHVIEHSNLKKNYFDSIRINESIFRFDLIHYHLASMTFKFWTFEELQRMSTDYWAQVSTEQWVPITTSLLYQLQLCIVQSVIITWTSGSLEKAEWGE